MSLRPGWAPPDVHLNIISGRGGLGDSLARLPAIKYMIETHPHVSATVYAQDGFLEVLSYLLPNSSRLTWRKLSEAAWGLKRPIIEFDMERLTTLHMHLTDHAFLILMDQLPPNAASRAYIKAERVELAQPALRALGPEVVFTTDFTAPAREWPVYHINALAVKCRAAGLTPVLLGTVEPISTGVEDDPIRPRQADGLRLVEFLDLRGKTTLIEALGVMQRAVAVVGVDNGLLHLAHCTDTPTVMGFTTLKPEHRVPIRLGAETFLMPRPLQTRMNQDLERGACLTKVLEAQVPCAGCQSRGFAINHDWRTCVMTEHRYACTMTLTAERFWDKLKELRVV